MSSRFFLDTNVFTYSFDRRNAAKREKAQGLIERAITDRAGFISYQVVQEFLNVALRKFERPFTVPECRLYLERVLYPLCEVFPSLELYRRALEIQGESGLSFYDCLIVASAAEGNGKVLYSEDLQEGRKLSGLTIQNPFS